MMKIKLIFLFGLLILLITPGELVSQDNSNLPNDVKWVTKSKEYMSLSEQIYISAWMSIRTRLSTVDTPIIIMDLDETVLDNSEYQVALYQKNEKYNSKSWNKWVKKEVATLVPGAKEFILRYKKHTNARIIFISNRDDSTLKATKNNMKSLGVFFEEDIFLLRKDVADTKVIRRQEVFSGTGRMQVYGPQKVLAYFGDAMGDFPNDEKYKFAINKFIFPNPMYGKW